MKIVHEINQLEFGGVERVVRNLIKFDKKNEHTIITYKDGAFRPELEKVGAKIVLLENEKDAFEGESDIFHIHTGGGDSRLARELGRSFPIIETIHSPVRSILPGDIIAQKVGVSQAVSNLNHNCVTVHNGLDIEECIPQKDYVDIQLELGIDNDVMIVGRLGRIGRDKGLEEWLLVCHELQKQGLEFIPVVVGGPSEEDKRYLGKMKLMAECLPVKNIKWIGHRANAIDYLQIIDIFMYPSATEGFGLVFAEAMLAGCAVAAWKTDVTMELFGGYAVLTDQTVKDLVEGTKKLFDSSYRCEFSGLSNEFVKSEYNAERMCRQYQEIYERSV